MPNQRVQDHRALDRRCSSTMPTPSSMILQLHVSLPAWVSEAVTSSTVAQGALTPCQPKMDPLNSPVRALNFFIVCRPDAPKSQCRLAGRINSMEQKADAGEGSGEPEPPANSPTLTPCVCAHAVYPLRLEHLRAPPLAAQTALLRDSGAKTPAGRASLSA